MGDAATPGVVPPIAVGLGYLLMEVAADAVGEGLLYVLWHLAVAPFSTRGDVHPAAGHLGLIVAGAACGVLSYLFHAERVLRTIGPRGVSLVLAPLVLGAMMGWVGQRRRRRGSATPLIATFWGGALCAFAMAVTRYALFF